MGSIYCRFVTVGTIYCRYVTVGTIYCPYVTVGTIYCWYITQIPSFISHLIIHKMNTEKIVYFKHFPSNAELLYVSKYNQTYRVFVITFHSV